jgi:phosphatidylserine decarboxylase
MQQNNAAIISRKNFAEELKSIGLKEQASVHDLFEGNTTVIYSKPE